VDSARKNESSLCLYSFVFSFSLPAVVQSSSQDAKSKLDIVVGSGGPGFTSPAEAVQALRKGILPTFDAILKLQRSLPEEFNLATGQSCSSWSYRLIMKLTRICAACLGGTEVESQGAGKLCRQSGSRTCDAQ